MAENISKLKKTIANLEKENSWINRELNLFKSGLKELMPELQSLKQQLESTRIKVVHLEVLSRAASDPDVD